MTPKERAWEVCKWLDTEIGQRIEAEERSQPLEQLEYGVIRERIEQAIIGAVEAKIERAWSTEYPAQPGLYWLRNYTLNHYPYRPEWNESESVPTVVEMVSDRQCWFIGTEVPRERDDFLSAEWSGPITPE